MREANTFDLSLLILLAIIWGSSFFNIKIATYSYDPITLALVRVIFASVPLLLLCKFSGIKIEAFGKNWNWYAIIGLCNIAIPFVLIAIGTAKINSYLAAILMSTTPSIDSVPIYNLIPLLFFLNIKIPRRIITKETKTLHVIVSSIKKYPKTIPKIGIKYAT